MPCSFEKEKRKELFSILIGLVVTFACKFKFLKTIVTNLRPLDV
jgi:hypothetical protein